MCSFQKYQDEKSKSDMLSFLSKQRYLILKILRVISRLEVANKIMPYNVNIQHIFMNIYR